MEALALGAAEVVADGSHDEESADDAEEALKPGKEMQRVCMSDKIAPNIVMEVWTGG